MPRSKRSPYNSGLHVPLIVSIPGEAGGTWRPPDYQPGGKTDRLVSFVDLAPTMLSLAGMRAAGLDARARVSRQVSAPHRSRTCSASAAAWTSATTWCAASATGATSIFATSCRTAARAARGVHVPDADDAVWQHLHDAGKLHRRRPSSGSPSRPEELYDLQTDPDEVNNLAASPHHQEVLRRVCACPPAQVLAIRDVGFLPEDEIHAVPASGRRTSWGTMPRSTRSSAFANRRSASSLEAETTKRAEGRP